MLTFNSTPYNTTTYNGSSALFVLLILSNIPISLAIPLLLSESSTALGVRDKASTVLSTEETTTILR